MVVLTGRNLGERQRELNAKVAEVVVNKKAFSEVKAEEEVTDTDKLYKIDIASQYKDVEYIIEILKSGDSLYVSRALKCLWLYDDSYSHVVNGENLHENIFPFMSLKMKTKMLSTISMHIRNKDRAASFYTYCKKSKLPGIAMKFLNFTSEEFKLDVIKHKDAIILDLSHSEKSLENFVGNSFTLAMAVVEKTAWHRERSNIVHNLRFLYSVSNEKYLDIVENYEGIHLKYSTSLQQFGIRISKDIMVKHKNRVLKHPSVYVNKLNKKMLVKYSTSEDAKIFLPALLPENVKKFWETNCYGTYDYILDLIPINEKFEYMKTLFISKYPDENFEMTINFYNLKYYSMLTVDEREQWAFRHIQSEKEILGSGNDYIWYKFVKFDKALVELKKYIMITPDKDKRSKILNVLVESARNQNDLIQLLNYYYDRHINESEYHKELFINNVLNINNVFEFNIECWEALNKLFCSLEIYTTGNYSSNKMFQAIAVACHILHNKDMAPVLLDFIDRDINYSYFRLLLEKVGKEKSEIIFQYILKFLVEKLKPFEKDPYNKELREELVRYVHNINNLLYYFHKDDKERPSIVKTFMDIHSPKTKERKTVTAEDIVRMLKKDAKLTVDVLSELDNNFNYWPRRFNHVLRKLKVYFPKDVAVEYTNFFHQALSKLPGDYNNFSNIKTAIHGIFMLADESVKVSLMEKYQPSAPKINHSAADRKLLFIQEAICRLVGYCRPPMPLQNVLKYIIGDYVHFCLPIFNMYLGNLPMPQAIEFTRATLNAPVSIQKHALRTAFKCYTSENLKNLVLNVWKKSKNVSLRMILYKSLFDKIIDADEDSQVELYEVLKFFTSDLHKDDDKELFSLICSHRMPVKFKNDYLQTAWDMIVKLPEKPDYINYQIAMLYCIQNNFNLIQREFVYKSIIEKHVEKILINRRLHPYKDHNEMETLCNKKWELTARYIVSYDNNEEMEENLKLLSFIFEKCLEMWNELYNEKEFVSRTFYFNFLENIKSNGITYNKQNSVPIFQYILDLLKKTLPITEIYLTMWNLQSTIYALNSENAMYDRGDDFKPTTSFFEEISVKYADQIGAFIKHLLEKQQFYPVFLKDIAYLVKCNLQFIEMFSKQNSFNVILFCESLVNLQMKETHLLAMIILPADEKAKSNTIYKSVLTKILDFKDDEVQSYFYSRFILKK